MTARRITLPGLLILLLMVGWVTVAPLAAQGTGGAGQNADPSLKSGAVLRSIALPGWGQRYLGRHDLARSMFIREAGLWLGIAVLNSAAGWYEEDFRTYAALHAGAEYRRKPDIYYFRLAHNDSMDDYNQVQLRIRDYGALYPEGSGWEWSWDSSESRQQFNRLRLRSLWAGKGGRFVAGSLILHRAIAVVQVLYLTRTIDRLSSSVVPLPGGGVFQLSVHF